MANTTATDWVNKTTGCVVRNRSAEFIATEEYGTACWVLLPLDAIVESGYIVEDDTSAQYCVDCGRQMRPTGRNASSIQTTPMGLFVCETTVCSGYGSPVLVRIAD